jgi:recombination protein RecA
MLQKANDVSRPSKRLQQTLWDLQKRFGPQAVTPLSQLAQEETTSIATGFPTLDAVLSLGGIPRSRITDMVGVPTSGMTTLAYCLLASAQADDSPAAYVDLQRTFDTDYAVACGVQLDRLLIVRPSTTTRALDILRDLVSERGAAAVVLDVVGAHSPFAQAGLSTLLRRLHERVTQSRSALVLLQSASSPTALDPYIHTRLLMQRSAWLYKHQNIEGYEVRVTVAKDKGAAMGEKQVTLAIHPGSPKQAVQG